MHRIIFFIICSFFLFASATAQDFTLNGTVTDQINGEEMIGATVFVKGTSIGVVSNEYGFYALTLAKGTYSVQFQYLGYKTKEIEVVLDANKTVNVELAEDANVLQEAVVSAEKEEAKVENKKISVVKLDIKTIKEIPVVFGEVDILKTITFLPGIQSLGEGSSGISVRGGGQDQNLILLDEAPVYNASHLLGFFSVFNGDAIKDLEVYKGGIPAKYGGRLSSLIDIRMKDGNNKKFAATGGIGSISSRLTLEGPIVKDKSSFMIAGRRSYADIFLPLANNEDIENSALYFYDLNLKTNYKISDKDRLYLSGYFGRDVFRFSELFGVSWGNSTATLRWNHLFGEKLFSNVSLIYSDFDYGVEFKFADNAYFGSTQGFKDYNLKIDFANYFKPGNKLSFGGQVIHHKFNPGEFKALNEETEETIGRVSVQLENKRALESAVYIDHEWKKNARYNFRYGLRVSMFNNIGKATEYQYGRDEFNKPFATDTSVYEKNKIYNTNIGLEPRMSFSYNLNTKSAVKASYNRTYQYIQQASNSATTLPVDQWFPSNVNVEPQLADQIALGYFINFDKQGLEISVEAYHKLMQNQIDYRDGASLFFNEQLDGELLFGKAKSTGLEFYIQKNTGKLTGFIAYTLSATRRQVDLINRGDWYIDNNDRPHSLSVVGTYTFNKRVSLSGTFSYVSGKAFTSPVSSYIYDGKRLAIYGDRNNDRVPAYHRADIGLNLKNKEKVDKRIKSTWNFSVYNVYARENPFVVNFEEVKIEGPDGEEIPNGQTQAVQIALFKLIPSITWNFEF